MKVLHTNKNNTMNANLPTSSSQTHVPFAVNVTSNTPNANNNNITTTTSSTTSTSVNNNYSHGSSNAGATPTPPLAQYLFQEMIRNGTM